MIEQLRLAHALTIHGATLDAGEEETNIDKKMTQQRRPEGALP